MAELVLVNANVLTMVPGFPKAQLVAIRNGKILFVGTNDAFKEWRHKKTRVIDCRGKTVLPGFIDAHLHFLAFAESLITLNLSPRNHIHCLSDIQEKIRQRSRSRPAGTWIIGGGYDEFHLEEKRHPTRWDLDAATSDHPVKLRHRTGHAHVLNSLGLALTGISHNTPDPPDSLVDRDRQTGEPTGLIYGAGDWLSGFIPRWEDEQIREGIRRADRELLSLGITSIQDASHRNDLERWKRFHQWKTEGLMKVRVSMMAGAKNFHRRQMQLFSTMDKNTLRLGGVKIVLNETTGRLSPCQEELDELMWIIHQSGFQAAIHAVEENPIEAACKAVERALRKLPRKDHRHRIEHASVCPPRLCAKMASLGLLVVTQPSFLYYHGDRYLRTVPHEQLEHLYPVATLMKKGVIVAGSSDCPVVPADPLIGIGSAVTRAAQTGEKVLREEGIPLFDALNLYTLNAAKAGFEERDKGSLAPGNAADLVVLNTDLMRLHDDEWKQVEVETTVLGGEIVWEKT